MPLDRTWVNGLVNDDGSNTVGEVWDKADVQHIYDDVDQLQHYCEVARISPHGISPGSWNPVYWDFKVSDPQGMCAVPTINIIPPVDAWYWVTALAEWPGGTGSRGLALFVNGAVDGKSVWAPAHQVVIGGVGVFGLTHQLTRLLHLGPSLALSIRVWQDTAASVNLVEGGTRVAVGRAS